MLSNIEWVTTKFWSVVDAWKRAVRTAGVRAVSALGDVASVFKIAVFLHSAKDFASVLRLYGIEECSQST